jgi:D-3-phosphoglycerate dehydrogenase
VDASYDLTPEQLLERVKTVDAIVIRSATKVTRAVFEASGGRLRVVGRAGVGIDNVDLTAASEASESSRRRSDAAAAAAAAAAAGSPPPARRRRALHALAARRSGALSSPPPAQYGCLVVNAPTANTVAAAEHGIALLTALARNVSQADAALKAGRWDRAKYVGVSVVGKTLAIIGFGKARPATHPV